MTEDHDPTTGTHRPPKYVEGVYKPHFVTPDADAVVFVYPLDYAREPHVADVDDDGCVRRTDDGKPMYEGGTTIAAVVVDGDLHYFGGWEDRLDEDDVNDLDL